MESALRTLLYRTSASYHHCTVIDFTFGLILSDYNKVNLPYGRPSNMLLSEFIEVKQKLTQQFLEKPTWRSWV